MNDFRFTLISSFIFIIIIGLGVLAFFALETGDSNGSRQIVTQLRNQVQEKDEALQDALRRIAEYEAQLGGQEESSDESAPEPAPEPEETSSESSSATNQHQSLINDLDRLRQRGAILEPGSRNADVGTIQQFLNIYNNTTGGVDNDFGPATRRRVEAFQTAQNTSVTGAVGPQTLQAMITWLQNNG